MYGHAYKRYKMTIWKDKEATREQFFLLVNPISHKLDL